MNLIFIFGPAAVGKMTVGNELAKHTGFKLFHNHMTIDLVTKIFPFETPQFRRLCDNFRKQIFEEVASSDIPGIIFTYVWAFDQQEDHDLARIRTDFVALPPGGPPQRDGWLSDHPDDGRVPHHEAR